VSDDNVAAPEGAAANEPTTLGDRAKRIVNPKPAGNLQQVGVILLSSLAAVVLALAIASFILWVSGYDAAALFTNMWDNLHNSTKMLEMLDRATPVMIAAVAVAIGFKMNLFNIGIEGQFLIGMFFAAWVGTQFEMFGPLHVAVILVVAMAAAAAWAGIAAVLKTERNVNEVISTIMLNSLALNVISFLFQEYAKFKDDSGSLDVKTRPIPESGWIPDIVDGKLSGVFYISLLVVLGYWLLVFKSRFGYRLRASGANAGAARTGGIASKRMIIIAMLISGAVAGLVGMAYLLGDAHAYYGTSRPEGFGFAGISVALLGRNHPLGIVISALLFGFLDTLTGPLQIDKIPVSIIFVIKAVILLSVVIINELVEVKMARRTADRTAAQLEAAGVAA